MKKTLKITLGLFTLILLLLVLTDTTYILRGVRTVYLRGNTDVTIHDFEVQQTRLIAANNPQTWPLHKAYNSVSLTEDDLAFHEQQESLAFLVIKDGQLLSETYFNEGSVNHLSSVWSISKTYTSLLLLKAQQDGLIDSIDDPVSKYLPEWNVAQEAPLTLRHLASMNTGLFWDEMDHSPFSLIAKLNFYGDLNSYTLKDLYAVGIPGSKQHYNSGGTQLLGTVLNNILEPKGKTISNYLEESFWGPLGYEHDGLFILDSKKHGHEKTFGGIVSTARNVSKLGQLINNNGLWNGQEILTKNDMQLLTSLPYNNTTYTYGLWTGLYKGERYIYQAGFGGQFCISFPQHNLVITRLGHKTSKKEHINAVSPDTKVYIEQALNLIDRSLN